jgi:hypothetical protein
VLDDKQKEQFHNLNLICSYISWACPTLVWYETADYIDQKDTSKLDNIMRYYFYQKSSNHNVFNEDYEWTNRDAGLIAMAVIFFRAAKKIDRSIFKTIKKTESKGTIPVLGCKLAEFQKLRPKDEDPAKRKARLQKAQEKKKAKIDKDNEEKEKEKKEGEEEEEDADDDEDDDDEEDEEEDDEDNHKPKNVEKEEEEEEEDKEKEDEDADDDDDDEKN